MHVLAIPGSLRARSSNRAALEAAQLLAPPQIEVELYEGLGGLPLFNPDLERDALPPAVEDLRSRIGLADGLLISSPEYARGISGAMKNALDWLVGSAEFPDKPVVLVNTSPRASDADAALRLVLRTMSARLGDAPTVLPLLGRDLDAEAISRDPALAATLRAALDELARMLVG